MDDLTGKVLGPYRLLAPIGRGGMAVVYKAYQPSLDRIVAIKVLPRQLALDPEFVSRFEREAKVIASLVHPNILPLHDFGHALGYTYLVMPFIDGGTLAQQLTGRPLPPPHMVHVLTQLADALDYAHACGIVHRDIKPSNVLVDRRGNCLLTDFGLARVVEEMTQVTRPGEAIGTPAYMSPEQGRGEKVDQRSDLYSLGIVLFEMATGRVPYQADTPVAIMMKHIRDPLPSARALNPALAESVERVIDTAMAKSPAARFATAGAMARALRAAVSAAPVAASTQAGRRARLLELAGKWVPSSSRARFGLGLLAGIIGGLLFFSVIGLAGVGALALRTGRTSAPPSVTPALSQARPVVLIVDPLAGSRQLYIDDFDGAGPLNWQVDPGASAALDSGCLVLSAPASGSGGISLPAEMQEGEAALFLVQYEADSQFRLAITGGDENQPSLDEWGLQQTPGRGFEPVVSNGQTSLAAPLVRGQLAPQAGHWYFVLLRAGGASEFAMRIWERGALTPYLEWRQAMPPNFSGLSWNVRLDSYAGRLIIDRYEQLDLGQPPG